MVFASSSNRSSDTPSPPNSTPATPTMSSSNGGMLNRVFGSVRSTLTGLSNAVVHMATTKTVRTRDVIIKNLTSQVTALDNLVGAPPELIDTLTKKILDLISDSWFLNTLYGAEVRSSSSTSAPQPPTEVQKSLSYKELIVRSIVTMAIGNIVKATRCREDGRCYFSDVMSTISQALDEGCRQVQTEKRSDKTAECRRGLAPLLHLAFPETLKKAETAVEDAQKQWNAVRGNPEHGFEDEAADRLQEARDQLDIIKMKLPEAQAELDLILGTRTSSFAWGRILASIPFEKVYDLIFDQWEENDCRKVLEDKRVEEEKRRKELSASPGGERFTGVERLLNLTRYVSEVVISVVKGKLAAAEATQIHSRNTQVVVSAISQPILGPNPVAGAAAPDEVRLSFLRQRIESFLIPAFQYLAKQGARHRAAERNGNTQNTNQDSFVDFLHYIRVVCTRHLSPTFIEEVRKLYSRQDFATINSIEELRTLLLKEMGKLHSGQNPSTIQNSPAKLDNEQDCPEDPPVIKEFKLIAQALMKESGLDQDERLLHFDLNKTVETILMDLVFQLVKLDPYLHTWSDANAIADQAELKYQQSTPAGELQSSLAHWILRSTLDNTILQIGFPDLFDGVGNDVPRPPLRVQNALHISLSAMAMHPLRESIPQLVDRVCKTQDPEWWRQRPEGQKRNLYRWVEEQEGRWRQFKDHPIGFRDQQYALQKDRERETARQLIAPSGSVAAVISRAAGMQLFQLLLHVEPLPKVVQDLTPATKQALLSWVSNAIAERRAGRSDVTGWLTHSSIDPQNQPPGWHRAWQGSQNARQLREWIGSLMAAWGPVARSFEPWIAETSLEAIVDRQAFVVKVREQSLVVTGKLYGALVPSGTTQVSVTVKQQFRDWLEGHVYEWLMGCSYEKPSPSKIQATAADIVKKWKECSQTHAQQDQLTASFVKSLTQAVGELPTQDPSWQFVYKHLHAIATHCLSDIGRKLPRCVTAAQTFIVAHRNEIEAHIAQSPATANRAEREMQELTRIFIPLARDLLAVLGISAHDKLKALSINSLLEDQLARLLVMGYGSAKKQELLVQHPLQRLCESLFHGMPLTPEQQIAKRNEIKDGLESVGSRTLMDWTRAYLQKNHREVARILSDSFHLDLNREAQEVLAQEIANVATLDNADTRALRFLIESTVGHTLPQMADNIHESLVHPRNGRLAPGNFVNTPQALFKHLISLVHQRTQSPGFVKQLQEVQGQPNRLDKEKALRDLFAEQIREVMGLIAGQRGVEGRWVDNDVENLEHPLYALPLPVSLKRSIWKELLPDLLSTLLGQSYMDLQKETPPLPRIHASVGQLVNQVTEMSAEMTIQLLPDLAESLSSAMVSSLRLPVAERDSPAQIRFGQSIDTHMQALDTWLQNNLKGVVSEQAMAPLRDFIRTYVNSLLKKGLTEVAQAAQTIDKRNPAFLTTMLAEICGLAKEHRDAIDKITQDHHNRRYHIFSTHPYQVPPQVMLQGFSDRGLLHPALAELPAGPNLEERRQQLMQTEFFIPLAEKLLRLGQLNEKTMASPEFLNDTTFALLKDKVLPRLLHKIYDNSMSQQVFNTLQMNIASELTKRATDNGQNGNNEAIGPFRGDEEALHRFSGDLFTQMKSWLPDSIVGHVMDKYPAIRNDAATEVGNAVIKTVRMMQPNGTSENSELGMLGLVKKIITLAIQSMHPMTVDMQPARPIATVDGEYELAPTGGRYTFTDLTPAQARQMRRGPRSEQAEEQLKQFDLKHLHQDQMLNRALREAYGLGVQGMHLGVVKTITSQRDKIDAVVQRQLQRCFGQTLTNMVLGIIHLFEAIIAIPFVLLYGIVVIPLMYLHVGRQVNNLRRNFLDVEIHKNLILKSIDAFVNGMLAASEAQNNQAMERVLFPASGVRTVNSLSPPPLAASSALSPPRLI